ncbi:hypothetical protein PHOBOS_117 [Erwinia phage vB_EamM_Phobos]|uniref:hypothetical protein n=1 Tax=Erwinia phage vB_EamM_Phobos TaxID=1883377 RepID=UPI00081C8665|nr:hypothetical protein BIZ79_gp117 [Erwinia phage vB_EamM_Phobos]ANZ50307.1 hypothetical protein PHOBOS_117 [Erwinia phage vB_EamM_Phobos]
MQTLAFTDYSRKVAPDPKQCTFYGTKREVLTEEQHIDIPWFCFKYVGGKTFTQRIIVSAAMRYKELGLVLPCARHYSADLSRTLDRLIELGVMKDKKTQVVGEDQGFIDNFGDYWNRAQALHIAKCAGQLEGRDKTGGEDELYSEDLY